MQAPPPTSSPAAATAQAATGEPSATGSTALVRRATDRPRIDPSLELARALMPSFEMVLSGGYEERAAPIRIARIGTWPLGPGRLVAEQPGGFEHAIDAVRNERSQPTPEESTHVQSHFAAAQKDIDEGSPVKADAELMTALSARLTSRQEIECLRLAGHIAALEGRTDHAISLYHACASRAAGHSKAFNDEHATATALLEGLRTKVDTHSFEQAAQLGNDSQTLLDDLLLEAAHRHAQDSAEAATAVRLYDQVMPNLMSRRDKEPALAALQQRSRLSSVCQDGKRSVCEVKLAHVLFELGRHYGAVLHLKDSISSPSGWLPEQDLLRVGLSLGAKLLGKHGYTAEANACSRATLRRLDMRDRAMLDQHLDKLAPRLRARAQAEAAKGNYKPLLSIASDLAEGFYFLEAAQLYDHLLDRSGIESDDVMSALETRLMLAERLRDSPITMARIRLAFTEHLVLHASHVDAARHLQKALRVNLQGVPLLQRRSLDCAAAIAEAAGDPRKAVYLQEAARLFAQKMNAPRTPAEESRTEELANRLENQLDDDDIETAEDYAHEESEKNFNEAFRTAREVIGQVLAAG